MDAPDAGGCAVAVDGAELGHPDVQQVDAADEFGGGFGWVVGEEGEAAPAAEVLGDVAVAVGVDFEGGGPVEVEVFGVVGALG